MQCESDVVDTMVQYQNGLSTNLHILIVLHTYSFGCKLSKGVIITPLSEFILSEKATSYKTICQDLDVQKMLLYIFCKHNLFCA